MKKLGKRILLVFAALALAAAPALASTITFSELGLSPGNSLTTQLASLGVLFSITNGTAVIGSGSGPAGSTIVGQYLTVNSTVSQTAQLNIEFVDPANSSVAGYVDGSSIFLDLWDTNDVPSPRVTVNAYDEGNVLLGTYNLTNLYENNGGGLTGDVHRLEVIDNGGDGHVLDNLDYGDIITPPGPQEIPEPGTFFLMGAGLVGLGLAMRRMRA